MTNDNLPDIWKTQKSLTEWFHDIKHKDTETIRREDNLKRERLKVLNRYIALPFDKPTQFEAIELMNNTPALQKYVAKHGNDLCALRLIPKQDNLPKLRMRGKSVKDALVWFHEQTIDPAKYTADFIPHTEDSAWATIFIVNKHGIQGEIIYGGHHQLTQGFHEDTKPAIFYYDFKTWNITPHNNDALEHLQKLASHILIEDTPIQQKLHKELGATFTNNYLEGYFETTDSSAGTWFIDYSPTLGKLYADAMIAVASSDNSNSVVKGMVGCKGSATGTVRIVQPDQVEEDFGTDFILVCPVTTPSYVPLMQKAAAIVTDQGGILSHAAIIARELKKPCIVGTTHATSLLKEGQQVTVDANSGTVTLG